MMTTNLFDIANIKQLRT